AYLQHLLDNEEQDGRFPTPENKVMAGKVRAFYADLHRKEWNDAAAWMERQVYLNIGTLLLGAAMLGVDAVPIEGIDKALLNAEFDLKAQGYSASVVLALGYHAADDVNATLPKSRLPDAQLFTHLA
ncbi:MAG: nitroreductase family protein, partial [Moraxella osloensis]|nr:nitroreductase family protein [Moraxella osloensis]